jgi:hypothetical protein
MPSRGITAQIDMASWCLQMVLLLLLLPLVVLLVMKGTVL